MEKEEFEKEIRSLSLLDKCYLVCGDKPNHSVKIGKIGGLILSDGPSGVRMLDEKGDSLSGIADTLPSTVFPSGSTIANSFNQENFLLEGMAIGKEASFYNVDIILGPALNIQRNPLCGRNFEYFSEDPYLSGMVASNLTKGIQEAGIGACLKHFCCNGNEKYRFIGDSLVSKRALEEIYLAGFKMAIQEANPLAIMCAYNKVNNIFCSENSFLLKDKLRNEYGFSGLVMTDWGGTHDKVEAIRNGLDLEMPGNQKHNVYILKEAIEKKELDENILDERIRSIYKVQQITSNKKKYDESIFDQHKSLALDLSLDSAVLLKNKDNILPLKLDKKYAVIGSFFAYPRYQGCGSSMLNPYYLSSFKEEFDSRHINYSYSAGYIDEEDINPKLEEEAIKAASNSDITLFFGGLSDFIESEGFDKESLKLKENQFHLLKRLLALNKKIVFVMFTGSPIDLNEIEGVDAILNMGLAGEMVAKSTSMLLFGEVCPSGHLAETWINKIEDIPNYKQYTSSPNELYKDDIYVGYRYYETFKKNVRYPFGYGLSYTSFEYKFVSVKEDEESLFFAFNIKNNGSMYGKCLLQLYVNKPRLGSPSKELVGFRKEELKVDEEKEITIRVDKSLLCAYNSKLDKMLLQDGVYSFFAGFDVASASLVNSIHLKGSKEDGFDVINYLDYKDEDFASSIGVKLNPTKEKKPYMLETRIDDFTSISGRLFRKATIYFGGTRQYKKGKRIKDPIKRASEMKAGNFVRRLMGNNSLRSLSFSSSGTFSYPLALLVLGTVNGNIFKGIRDMKKEKSRYGK